MASNSILQHRCTYGIAARDGVKVPVADMYPDRKAWQYYTDITGNLTGDASLGISALDIPAILTPVKSFFAGNKKSQQFR